MSQQEAFEVPITWQHEPFGYLLGAMGAMFSGSALWGSRHPVFAVALLGCVGIAVRSWSKARLNLRVTPSEGDWTIAIEDMDALAFSKLRMKCGLDRERRGKVTLRTAWIAFYDEDDCCPLVVYESFPIWKSSPDWAPSPMRENCDASTRIYKGRGFSSLGYVERLWDYLRTASAQKVAA